MDLLITKFNIHVRTRTEELVTLFAFFVQKKIRLFLEYNLTSNNLLTNILACGVQDDKTQALPSLPTFIILSKPSKAAIVTLFHHCFKPMLSDVNGLSYIVGTNKGLMFHLQ